MGRKERMLGLRSIQNSSFNSEYPVLQKESSSGKPAFTQFCSYISNAGNQTPG
jgi:hypothetical protein